MFIHSQGKLVVHGPLVVERQGHRTEQELVGHRVIVLVVVSVNCLVLASQLG